MSGPKRPRAAPLWTEPTTPTRGRVTRALGRTVSAMRAAGQLDAIDEILVAATREAARLVDETRGAEAETAFTQARALAELGAWVDRLAQLRGDGGDALDDLLRLLSADLGDDPIARAADDRP